MHAIRRAKRIPEIRTPQPVRALSIDQWQQAGFMRGPISAKNHIPARLPPVGIEEKTSCGVIEGEKIPAHFFERLSASQTLGRALESSYKGLQARRHAPLLRFR